MHGETSDKYKLSDILQKDWIVYSKMPRSLDSSKAEDLGNEQGITVCTA